MMDRPVIYLVTFVTKEFLLPDGRPSYPPVSALYLASALRKAGFEPRVLHLLSDHLEQLGKWMEDERPIWVGFSVLTGSMLAPTLEASRRARKLGIRVVWGGVHASMVPRLCLSQAADYTVVGEAEETVMELAGALADRNPAANIAGVVNSGQDGVNQFTARKPLDDLDRFPPAWDLIDPAQYIDYRYDGGQMPFLFSRGCPYRCRFCYNEAMRAGKWRRHSDEYLDETLERLQRSVTFSAVNFHDDFLFESPGKSSSWIEVLSRRGLKWSASFRAHALTDEFARWIEENGCDEVRIGMESGHLDTLKKLGKDLTVEDHYRAVHALAKTSIRGTVAFIINWPGETRESILAALRLTDELARINRRLRFRLEFYIPMPGPPIYREAIEDGFKHIESNYEWSRVYDHPYRFRGFSRREREAIEIISGRLYQHYLKPWPMQGLIEPVMRWRWRHGYFRWFAIGALRRWVKAITGIEATRLPGPD